MREVVCLRVCIFFSYVSLNWLRILCYFFFVDSLWYVCIGFDWFDMKLCNFVCMIVFELIWCFGENKWCWCIVVFGSNWVFGGEEVLML